MSTKSELIHSIEKSKFSLNVLSRIFNKLCIKNTNTLYIKSIHFKNNRVSIFGHKNSILCDINSFLNNYNSTINGNDNCVSINASSQLYGNGKSMYIFGNNNRVIIGENCRLNGVNFFISGNNNTISLGDNCSLNDVELHIEQENNGIYIGNGCTFHGRGARSIHIAADEGSNIIIKDDCMISNDVQMRSTDSHSIVNENNERINPAKDIILEKHCWVGLGVIILKGTETSENTVIAAGAVCSKKYTDSNCILAGNPAKAVKHNIDWDRKFL